MLVNGHRKINAKIEMMNVKIENKKSNRNEKNERITLYLAGKRNKTRKNTIALHPISTVFFV